MYMKWSKNPLILQCGLRSEFLSDWKTKKWIIMYTQKNILNSPNKSIVDCAIGYWMEPKRQPQARERGTGRYIEICVRSELFGVAVKEHTDGHRPGVESNQCVLLQILDTCRDWKSVTITSFWSVAKKSNLKIDFKCFSNYILEFKNLNLG